MKSPPKRPAIGAPGSPVKLDLNHLELFRVAGRLQHVTQAAAQLGMSQPALSRALTKLEADLGVPLFRPAGRSVVLTRYGEIFLRRVEKALREIEEGRIEVTDLTGIAHGAVSIGFLRSLATRYIPRLIRRFGAVHPGIRFSFTPNHSAALKVLLERGDLDLIFTSTPQGPEPFTWKPVSNQELALIVAADHRLAGREEIDLAEAADEQFLTFPSGHPFRQLTEKLCAEAGFTPKIFFEGEESSSLPGFVAAGFGVAIVPPESGAAEGISTLRIARPMAQRVIGIGWMEDRYLPASAIAFRDFALTSGQIGRDQ